MKPTNTAVFLSLVQVMNTRECNVMKRAQPLCPKTADLPRPPDGGLLHTSNAHLRCNNSVVGEDPTATGLTSGHCETLDREEIHQLLSTGEYDEDDCGKSVSRCGKLPHRNS